MPLQLTGPDPWYYFSPFKFWFFHVDIRGYVLSYGSYCPTYIYFPGLLVHQKVWVRKETLCPTPLVLQVMFLTVKCVALLLPLVVTVVLT
jgi:hypothetical protein